MLAPLPVAQPLAAPWGPRQRDATRQRVAMHDFQQALGLVSLASAAALPPLAPSSLAEPCHLPRQDVGRQHPPAQAMFLQSHSPMSPEARAMWVSRFSCLPCLSLSHGAAGQAELPVQDHGGARAAPSSAAPFLILGGSSG